MQKIFVRAPQTDAFRVLDGKDRLGKFMSLKPGDSLGIQIEAVKYGPRCYLPESSIQDGMCTV